MHAPAPTAALMDGMDPFAAVLQSLSEISGKLGQLTGPVADVDSFVTTVDEVLADIQNIPSDLMIINEILEALDGLLDILDAIPFVDIVAAPASAVVDFAITTVGEVNETAQTFVSDVVNPVKDIFDDLKTGLQKASDVLQAISQTVPNYLNTIQILDYMDDVATPLTQVVQGNEAADRLAGLVTTFNTLKNEVGTDLKPVVDFLGSLLTAIEGITQALGTAYTDIKNTAATVASDLDDIEGVFQPIKDDFDKVANAIAPVKWVLHAFKWLFDKVFEPVVNKIMEATGLDAAIFTPLKNKISAELGITPITQMLSQHVSASQSAGWQQGAGSGAAGTGESNWSGLAALLEQYNTRNNGGAKSDILLLVTAITGSPIDPTKPSVIPDWPSVPDLGQATATSPAFLLAANLKNNRRNTRLDNGFIALRALAAPAAAPLKRRRPLAMELPVVRALVSDTTLDNVTALQSEAATAVSSLQAIENVAQTLVNSLAAFDAARSLPQDFGEQMTDLASLFTDGVQFLDFLKGIPLTTALGADLLAPVQEQATLAASVQQEAVALVTAAQGVDAQILAVEAAVPRPQVFTDVFNFIDAAATGGASLAAVLSQARQVDQAQLNGQFESGLNSLGGQLDTAAGAVLAQLQNVVALATTALQTAQSINAYLLQYAQNLSALQTHAQVVGSTALPNLTKGVHYLGLFTSILDPLSNLLQATGCTDAGNPVKSGAAGCVSALDAAVNGFFTQHQPLITEAFQFVVDKAVPLPALQSDLQTLSAFVSEQGPAFGDQVTQLQATVKQLAAAMQPQNAYQVGSTQVPNLLISQDFATAAGNLLQQIEAAANLTPSEATPS